MDVGFLSIVPIVLTIVLAIVTRNVIVSLFTGLLCGALIISGGNPVTALTSTIGEYIIPRLLDSYNAGIIVLLVFIGGFVTLLEKSVNHTIFFDRYAPVAAAQGVSLLTAADEDDFRRLHNWPDMYWNAERILADLPNWKVYLHRENGAAVAALVCRAGDWPEVFSVDFGGGEFLPESYRCLMAACLNDLHAAGCTHMSYFEEDECALPILASLGFERVGWYLGYRKELKEE